MPDTKYPKYHPGTMDAHLALTQALRHLMRARAQDARLPRELREVAAAGALVEMAKELERETVRVARGIGRQEGLQVVFTATGATRGPARFSWAAIGAAVGITAQSAHERWARRVTAR